MISNQLTIDDALCEIGIHRVVGFTGVYVAPEVAALRIATTIV